MRSTKKVTPEQEEYLRANYVAMTLKQMGVHFGVSNVTIKNWLHKIGIEKKPQVPGIKSTGGIITEEVDRAIRELWDTGLSASKVASKLNVSRYLVEIRVQKFGGVRRLERFFDAPLNRDSAYVLGFVLADGSLDLRVKRKDVLRIPQNEACILEDVRKAIGGGSVTVSGGNRFVYRLCSDYAVKRLRELGVRPRKTYTGLEVSSEVSDDLFPHFFRGFFDGDGNISVNPGGSPTMSVHSTDRKFLETLNARFKKWTGKIGTVRVACAKGTPVMTPTGSSEATVDTHSLSYGKRSGLGLIARLMYNDNGISLSRKRKKLLPFVTSS